MNEVLILAVPLVAGLAVQYAASIDEFARIMKVPLAFAGPNPYYLGTRGPSRANPAGVT